MTGRQSWWSRLKINPPLFSPCQPF